MTIYSSQSRERRRPSTLVELVQARAYTRPDDRAYVFLNDRGVESETLTYQELHRRAASIAAVLQTYHLEGKPVLLIYEPGLEFIAAFVGCLYAGALAVPVSSPRRNQLGTRLDCIAAATQAFLALTSSKLLSTNKMMTDGPIAAGKLEWMATDTISIDEQNAWIGPRISPQTVAFLQFTSGSTTSPKGVVLTHENILYNQRMIECAFEHSEKSIVFGWLPLYHDMGLIGNVLQPLYVGVPCFLMSPLAFLLKPYRWLEAITHYRVTTSGAPDFAYDLCVRRVTDEQILSLDLSSWDLAFCGSEKVRSGTIERFAEKFAPCGFRREAFYPCYGLAEATLLVSGGKKAAPPAVSYPPVESPMLDHQKGSLGMSNTSEVVGCGTSKLEQRIFIVDPETMSERPPRTMGEIWIAGANVAHGYWNDPEETDRVFNAHLSNGDGPFLRTGDLGFMDNGELFVQGRIKDVIIIRGCNFYPEDIEQTVERSHAALKPRRSAAFSVEEHDTEHLIIVQEVQRNLRDMNVNEIDGEIRQAVAETHAIQPHRIILVNAGTIPITSSGKIKRAQCKADFLNHKYDVVSGSHSSTAAPGSSQSIDAIQAVG